MDPIQNFLRTLRQQASSTLTQPRATTRRRKTDEELMQEGREEAQAELDKETKRQGDLEKKAADEAKRQQNNVKEAAWRAEGRPMYVDSDGVIQPVQPDAVWEQQKQEKLVKSQEVKAKQMQAEQRAADSKHRQQMNAGTAASRAAIGTVDDQIKTSTSEAELKALEKRQAKQRADRQAKELEDRLENDINLTEAQRANAEQGLAAIRQQAAALQAALDEAETQVIDRKKQELGWEKERQRMQREVQQFEAGIPLMKSPEGQGVKTGQEVKPVQEAGVGARPEVIVPGSPEARTKARERRYEQSVRDIEMSATLTPEQKKEALATVEKRFRDPKAYEQEIVASVQKLSDKELAQMVESLDYEVSNTLVGIQTKGAIVEGLEAQFKARVERLREARDQIVHSGVSMADSATLTLPDGTTEMWPAKLAETYLSAQRQHVHDLQLAGYDDLMQDVEEHNLEAAKAQAAQAELVRRDSYAKATEAKQVERAAVVDLYQNWGKDIGTDDWISDSSMTPRLQQEAQARGLTEEQARKGLQEIRQFDWSNAHRDAQTGLPLNETVRALPDGELTVNPDLLLDAEAHDAAVDASVGKPEAKARAKAKRRELAAPLAARAIQSLEKNAAFAEWLAKNTRGTPVERMEQFTAEMKKGGWVNAAVMKFQGGASNLPAGWLGALAGMTGSDSMLDYARYWKDRSAAWETAAAAAGKGTNAVGRFAGSVAGGAPSVLESMAIGTVAGRLSGSGKVALGAAALDAGAQSGGSTFVDAVDAYMRKGMSQDEAKAKALAPAMASAAVTALATSIGSKGVESLLTREGQEALKGGLKGFIANVAQEVGSEAVEEFTDQALQGVIAQATYAPEKGVGQILSEAIEAGLVGGVLGGFAGAISGKDQTPTEQGMLTPASTETKEPVKSDAQLAIEGYADPKKSPDAVAVTKARASALLKIGQGAKLEDLSEAELNGVGYARDPQTGEMKPGRYTNDPKTGALEWKAGETPPNHRHVYSVPDSKGKPQLVINQRALDKLREVLPAVADAIKLDEAARVAQIKGQAGGQEAKTISPKMDVAGASPDRGASPQVGAVAAQGAAGVTESGPPRAVGTPVGGDSAAPPAGVRAEDLETGRGGDLETLSLPEEERAEQLAFELGRRGLDEQQAGIAARLVVKRLGVTPEGYAVQMAGTDFDDAMTAMGWVRGTGKKWVLASPERWEAAKKDLETPAAETGRQAAPDSNQLKPAGSTGVPQSQAAKTAEPINQEPPAKVGYETGKLTAIEVPELIESKVWREAKIKAIDGFSRSFAKGKAQATATAVKSMQALERLVDEKFGRLFDQIVIGEAQDGGGLGAMMGRDGQTVLVISPAAFIRFGARTDGGLELALSEEVIHAFAQAKLSRAEVVGKVRQMEQHAPEMIRVWWQTYYAPAIQDGNMPANPPAKLSDEEAFHAGHEILRMMVQDAVFAGKVFESLTPGADSVTTETVEALAGIVEWLKQALKTMGQTLKQALGKLEPKERASMQRVIEDIADLYQRAVASGEKISDLVYWQKEAARGAEKARIAAEKAAMMKDVETPAAETGRLVEEEDLAEAADAYLDGQGKSKGQEVKKATGGAIAASNLRQRLAEIPDPDTGKDNILVAIARSGKILRPSKAYLERMKAEGKSVSKADWDWMERSPVPFPFSNLVFRAGNGSTMDRAIIELHGKGFFPGVAVEDVTGDMVAAKILDVIDRYNAKKSGNDQDSQEQRYWDGLEEQALRFERATESGPVDVHAASLQVGDVMLLKGDDGKPHRVEVIKLDLEPATEAELAEQLPNVWRDAVGKPVKLASVTLKDGTTFGVQTIDGDERIYVDALTVAPGKDSALFNEDTLNMLGDKGTKGLFEQGLGARAMRGDGTDPSGFYSRLSQVIEQKMPNRADVATIKGIISNPQTGIKAEELKWSGIMPWLESEGQRAESGGKITKQAVLEYLAADGAVRLEEVQMGGVDRMTAPRSAERLRRVMREKGFNASEADSVIQAAERTENIYTGRDEQINDLVQEVISDYRGQRENPQTNTKFAQYQLPGGENYREVVLALPDKRQKSDSQEVARLRAFNPILAEKTDEARSQEYGWFQFINGLSEQDQNWVDRYIEAVSPDEEAKLIGPQSDYTSSHFPDVPNYVAHMRVNDRVDAEGRPGTFLEEIQSDRHQAGREKGYQGEFPTDVLEEAISNGASESVARGHIKRLMERPTGDAASEGWQYLGRYVSKIDLNEVFHDRKNDAIPDAPFRKDWALQMFKRGLRDAVATGKEWIGWTTGDTQAERYDLSKQISSLEVKRDGDRYILNAYDINGNDAIQDKGVPRNELADVVGKDLANKIIGDFETNDAKREELRRDMEAARRGMNTGTESEQDAAYDRYKSLQKERDALDAPEEMTYEGDNLKVGGEGMKGFYDSILPKEIGKYVKQWGAGVVKGELAEHHRQKELSWLTDVHPLDTETFQTLYPPVKTPIWRVDITPAMRAGVEGGQVLFSRSMRGQGSLFGGDDLSMFGAGPLFPGTTQGGKADLFQAPQANVPSSKSQVPSLDFNLESASPEQLRAEATRRENAEKIKQRQSAPLVGTQGDIGQMDMLGGGDLFASPAPRVDTPTQDAPATPRTLESDRPRGTAAVGGREAGVSAGTGLFRADADAVGAGGNAGEDAEGNDRAPARGDAPAGGAAGAERVQGEASRVSGSPAGSAEPGGSSGIDEPRAAVESGAELDLFGTAPERPAADEVAQDRASTPSQRLIEQATVQNTAEGWDDIVPGDRENIAKTLPILLPQQHDDVKKTEDRWFNQEPTKDDPKKGMLFTNGTGTGKTFTGLGIIKRFEMMGRGRVLIVVPSQPKVTDWQNEGLRVMVKASPLNNTTDVGSGVVVTTYANFRANAALQAEPWDLIVYDESHYLGGNAQGTQTENMSAHYRATNKPGFYAQQKAEYAVIGAAPNPEDREAMQAYNERREAKAAEIEAKRKTFPDTKAVFLSATPFNYHKSLGYADGYLFASPRSESTGYNVPQGMDRYLVENFGYSMKTNRLTSPPPEVDVGLMEREWSERQFQNGSMSGRMIDVPYDYSREFILLDSQLGKQLDEGFQDLAWGPRGESREQGTYWEPLRRAFRNYWYGTSGGYSKRMQLLESIKVAGALERMNQHLDMGRKIVLFHSYNNADPVHPFTLNYLPLPTAEASKLAREWRDLHPDLVGMDFKRLFNPRSLVADEFGDRARFFNGEVSPKERMAGVKAFNADDSGVDVIMIQMEAGKEGISLHDVTGNGRQRVLMNAALPVKPTDAIQSEGRIYRIGVKSNAIQEYLVLHTAMERSAFGSKISERTGTVENMALGKMARTLKDSFKSGYLNAHGEAPSAEQGLGGKKQDTAELLGSDMDRAKSYYFGRQKKTSKTKAAEGIDYFATPEPVGLTMVRFLDAKAGMDLLEPSAGHGAIGRFFPEFTTNKYVEPSRGLSDELRIKVAAGKVEVMPFEDLHIVNKFDGVAMNPPFGTAGKMAMEHVAKAAKHLRQGGRLVALIPEGSAMEKRFEQWLYEGEGKDMHLRASYGLPTVTFERAGTSVKTRIVVLDKADLWEIRKEGEYSWTAYDSFGTKRISRQGDEATLRAMAKHMNDFIGFQGEVDLQQRSPRELSAETIGELFDQLEDLSPPGRIVRDVATEKVEADDPKTQEADSDAMAKAVAKIDQAYQKLDSESSQRAGVPASPASGSPYSVAETLHAKKGTMTYVAKMDRRLSDTEYRSELSRAKSAGGYYSAFKGSGAIPGFQFPSAAVRDAFVAGYGAQVLGSRAMRGNPATNEVQSAAIRGIFESLYGKETATRHSRNDARSFARLAARDLRREMGAPSRASETLNPSDIRIQAAILANWARDNGLLITQLPADYQPGSDRDFGQMEHSVWRTSDKRRVVKLTKPGQYGLYPVAQNIGLDMRAAASSPLRYLERLEMANQVFGDDWVLHGVLVNRQGQVQLLTSQPAYDGELPGSLVDDTPEEEQDVERERQQRAIAKAMAEYGFAPSRVNPSTFYRASDNTAVFDAHLYNVMWVDSATGPDLVPFDVIVMQPQGKLRENLQQQMLGSRAMRPADTSATSTAPVDQAAHEAATSPNNPLPEPTQAQKEAGNYKLGHVRISGHEISIENPAGSERKGTDPSGKAWSVTMQDHYGYFKGTNAKDGDHVDVFVKAGTPADYSGPVHVIRQVKVGSSKSQVSSSKTGSGKLETLNLKPETSDPPKQFDEYKVMLGYPTAEEARAAYLRNYAKGWQGLDKLTSHTQAEFQVIKDQVFTVPGPVREGDKVLAARAMRGGKGYLGTVADGEVIAVKVPDLEKARHGDLREIASASHEDGAKDFRFNPETQTVYWGRLASVTEAERQKVADWLEGDGQTVIGHKQTSGSEANYREAHGLLGSRAMDAEYLAAVEAGDMVKAQRMVDEAAKAAGYDIDAHHGARTSFTRFATPSYFSTTQEYADWFRRAKDGVEPTMRVKLKPGKTADLTRFGTDPITGKQYLDELQKQVGPLYETLIRSVEYMQSMLDVTGESKAPVWRWTRQIQQKSPSAFYQSGIGLLKQKETLVEDGQVKEDAVFLAMLPSQIKSADPVTRDESGKVIPLSQRFNHESDSILYTRAQRGTDPETTADSLDKVGEIIAKTGNAMFVTLPVWTASTAAKMGSAAVEKTGVQKPLAWLGSNRLDKWVYENWTNKWLWARARTGKEAVKAWLQKPGALNGVGKAIADNALPLWSVPREWLAMMHESQRKSAWGREKAMDVVRALSHSAKVSDLAYPKEFVENPAYRVQMFDAMEGKVPMTSLPKPLQELAARLRGMLETTGRELVKQELMNLDTFEELRDTGWMPRFTEDEAGEAAGSWLKAFKLGVKDLKQQRSTAWHIVDTTKKDATGQYVTVNRTEGAKRNRWRFRDERQRDGFYEDFIRSEAVRFLQEQGSNVTNLLAALKIDDKKSIREEIAGLTRASIDLPAQMTEPMRNIVRRAIELQRVRYKKEKPFEPDKLIKDPVYAVARYVMAQTHNAATMELMKETAKVKAWTIEPPKKVGNAKEAPPPGYTEIPENPRFGPLSGRWVRDDIATQVLDVVNVDGAAMKFYDSMLRKWKGGKLVLNPGSHIRDAVGNTAFAYLGGNSLWNPGNWPYYRDAIAILRDGGPKFAELIEMQVLGGDAYTTQVKTALRGLLPDQKTVENADAGALMRMVMGLGAGARGTYEYLSALRSLPDDFYKTAAFNKYRAQGMDPREAAAEVRKWFPYYDRLGTSAYWKVSGRFLNPFGSFFRESTRIMGRAAMERPMALSAVMLFASAVTRYSLMALGLGDDDEEAVFRAMRGKLVGGVVDAPVFSMLLPMRTSEGQLQQWDLSSVMPFADLIGTRVEMMEDEDEFTKWWRARFTSSPLLAAAWSASTNTDAFTGRKIVQDDMGVIESAGERLKNLAGDILPPLTPGVGVHAATLSNAGRRTNSLDMRNKYQSWIRALLGMDVRSADPDLRKETAFFRQKNNLPVVGNSNTYTTPLKSRLAADIKGELIQDEPDLDKIAEAMARLEASGNPVKTAKQMTDLLDSLDPTKLIKKEFRARLIASFSPEAKRVFNTRQTEFKKSQAKAPGILAEIRRQQAKAKE